MANTFIVQPDGSVSASKKEPETLVAAAGYSEIEGMMEDPNVSPEKVLRRILGGIVTCLRNMEICGSDPFQAGKFRQYVLEAHTLHRLEEAYIKHVSTEERDQLNFDGPTFQFVYNSVIKLMEQATREALGKNSALLAQRINKRFRDLVEKNEPDLRRRVQEIGSTTGTTASDATKPGKS